MTAIARLFIKTLISAHLGGNEVTTIYRVGARQEFRARLEGI